ncbi:MAG: hypothetical protein AAF050_01915 [Cyanobacteria bacterium J06649_5]
MSRESCITHRPKQAIAIVRQDYYELMDRDACAAALLNIFEYWANAALAIDVTTERPWIGHRPIREFEQMLLGIATDKQIRKRLVLLEKRGFIKTKAPTKRGAATAYQVLIPEIQQALVGHLTNQEIALRSFDRYSFGHLTEDNDSLRSNDRPTLGQMTHAPSVKRPTTLRSNDRALKNKTKEFKKESLKEAPFVLDDSSQEALEHPGTQLATEVGVVRYTQLPETIDLAELWATNPGMAKTHLRFIAPGHKRFGMVAHGFGQWWIGPGLNDFDESLIKACQKRKRKLQQPDSVGDAKTFINNMLKAGDWGNFSLRCEEAKVLSDRAAAAESAAQNSEITADSGNTLKRSETEQRAAAIGLAKFKISQGDIARAKEIADLRSIRYTEIGLTANGEKQDVLYDMPT